MENYSTRIAKTTYYTLQLCSVRATFDKIGLVFNLSFIFGPVWGHLCKYTSNTRVYYWKGDGSIPGSSNVHVKVYLVKILNPQSSPHSYSHSN